ncbi:MAG: hypothetical protein JST85_00365 [Acidobacteria bacterium]|nr:hypothetical protein [Acidobacteriota bacterium]
MHCPQCGQQPPTEQTRFCTHCGFALGGLKEFMTTGLLPGSPRQRDITLGGGLMLVGALKGFFLAAGIMGWPWEILILALGVFYGLLQLFFQLSPRQKGLSLGATLMFLGSVVAFLAGMHTEGFGAIPVALVTITMILFWKRLSAGFLKIFFDKTDAAPPRMSPQPKPVAALPPEQTPAVDTNRVRQDVSPEPGSIIEGTTKTLNFSGISEQ